MDRDDQNERADHAASISERSRRAEAALQDALDLLQAINQASPSGIVAYHEDGPCVFANAAAAAIIGASVDQLLAQNFRELPSWDASGLLLAAEQALDGGGVVHHDLHIVSTFGREVYLACQLTTFESRGEPHLLLLYEDSTDKHLSDDAMNQALDELERSNRELKQFAHVASHDLKEPLRMVASFTQLLAERYRGKLDARADMYIDLAVEGATRMHRLINSLLALSRVRRGERPRKRLACEELVQQVLRDMSVSLQESGARIIYDELPRVEADPPQLRQLLQNLIDNAIKFRSEQAPRVEISAEPGEDCWIFTVADNGIGIPEEYLERIFEPFQRLHLRQAYPGDGIGLAIARRVVERHGGTIRAESTVGEGTRIIFQLPAGKGVQ